MDNLFAIILVSFLLLISLVVRFSKKSKPSVPPRSLDISLISELAYETAFTLRHSRNLHKWDFLWKNEIAELDSAIFGFYIVRSALVSYIHNQKIAEAFSREYTSFFTVSASELPTKFGDFNEMFYSRTSFYDQLFSRNKPYEENLNAVIEEFSYIILTDVINKRYVYYDEHSPIPAVSVFDLTKCSEEISWYLDCLKNLTSAYIQQIRK